MRHDRPTTGSQELDRLIGGVRLGDNVVWEADSGAPVNVFVSTFLAACETDGLPVVYVSYNRSPQAIAGMYAGQMAPGRFTLVDCFSSGKGDDDATFLEFYKADTAPCRTVRTQKPGDPVELQELLARVGEREGPNARYVFDSLTGMLDLWRDEDLVLRFFGHSCPRLFDVNTVAYWLLEKGAHSEAFLAKLRHITQVVLELEVASGVRTLTVRKALDRRCADIGVGRQFEIADGGLTLAAESREDRELGLLTRIGRAVETALDPNSFFEQAMDVLANDLGMVRGTLVLLDAATNKLRIAAAHGLSAEERAKGEYAIGEGVTGHVVKSGLPEVVPDISQDPRFLDRTATRRTDPAQPIAFVCIPLKVDGEVVGALSADRPHATEAAIRKDLRLLSILGSTVSQVLKIHRMIGVDKDELLARDEGLLQELRSRFRLDNIVGQSEGIRRVLATAAAAAKSRASVLITGETGTGKELVANVVHYTSSRATNPYIKVNCGALPETLLEAELFGHVRGAFTGAVRDRKGRFELANGGTLFLDEIAEMSPRLQVKLLRVLQDGEFEPVGADRTLRTDARLVAATSSDLKERIRQGQFREDLYYRLNVIPIHLPPLRDRREDIPLLVDHFLEVYNRRNDRNVRKLSRQVLDLLLQYPWPGNVRELENCIERAVVLSPGDALPVSILPSELLERRASASLPHAARSPDDAGVRHAVETFCHSTEDLGRARDELIHRVEDTIFRTALERGTTQRELARTLGISRMTLRKRMRECGHLGPS